VDECFPEKTCVLTEYGRKNIGKIYNQKISCRVYSYNVKKQTLELKPIVNWIRKEKNDILKLKQLVNFGLNVRIITKYIQKGLLKRKQRI